MSGPLFITTDDGSHTLKHPTFLEHYHSTFGALQESRHVFIQSALEYYKSTEGGISLIEIGFRLPFSPFYLKFFCFGNEQSYRGAVPSRFKAGSDREGNFSHEFSRRGAKTQRHKVIKACSIKVTSVRVNQHPDFLFQNDFPPPEDYFAQTI